MIRPWYRSRLFWLGLPGLLFLLWLWLVFSPKAIYIEAGHKNYGVLSFRSAIEFTSEEGSGQRSWEVDVWPLEEEDRVDQGDHLFKRDYKVWPGESTAGHAFFQQDYLSMRPWLPSAVYLPLWLGVLAGWQRRKSRLHKPSVGSS